MIKPSAYDLPFDEQEKVVVAMATEALELRHGAGEDPEGPLAWVDPEDGARAAMAMLRRARARWARVNELRAEARKYLGRVSRAREDATFAVRAAESKAGHDISNARNRSGSISSRPEVDGDVFMAAYDEHRAEAKLKRMQSVIRDAYELITDAERQLDSIAVDLRRIVDLLGWESHLDG